MKQKILFMAAFTVAAVISSATPSYARFDCKSLDGNWSGTMTGKFRGPVTMSFRNCRLNWKLPDKRTNICRFKEKNAKIEYRCSLGSRGTVKINGSNITMRNTYTGNNYVVRVKKK